MSLPPVPVVHISIHNVDVQVNTVLSSGHGARVTQENSIHLRAVAAGTDSNTPHSTSHPSSAISRRVEAQTRIRQTLAEVATSPRYGSSRIGRVALSATGLLSIIEQESISFSKRLIELTMDAHAVAYVVVVSFLYRRQRMSRNKVDKLTELLNMIHTVLLEAAATGNVASLFTKIVTRNRRNIRLVRMREELLYLLRKIEKNDNAEVLSSLNAALDHQYQHNDSYAAE